MYLKELKEKHEYPKYLFLDQNLWIYLGQIHYGKRQNSTLSRILKKLKHAVSEGKLIIPINLTNAYETRKNKKVEQRERLAKFMVSISKGYAFIPFVYIENLEVENLIRIKLNLPVINIRENAIGKGVFYLIHDGSAPGIKSEKLDQKTIEFMKEKTEEHFSKEEQVLEFILNLDPNNHDWDPTIQELEALRTQGFKIKDKKYKQKLGMAQFIVNMIVPKIAIMCLKYRIHPSIFELRKGMDKIQEFLENLPFFNTIYILNKGLDEIPNHPINSHDLQDIYSFCFALPYCDYVAGENYVISLAKRNELDNLYRTKLYTKSDFNEFEAFLDNILAS